ncbi:M23 family metallopeptidase [Pseudoflavonifractor intestinihominis]|uniref:M23 family metallopeptidase n=1 Tax=Pseudoflavonifractor intestinihominis TaxID=3133171 RepID=A0ABV1EA38_9FIRM|nr:M23 family metallopeptidase [uncultured Pseudoflavonifractor sp.]
MESAYRQWEKRRERRQGRPAERRSGKKVALAPRECRRLVQLGVCIALFLVVFVGKGVFPEQMLAAREKIVQVIQGDTDFRAAFASLGQSISEGEPVLDTLGALWIDVFGGEQVELPDSGWEPLPLYTETVAKLQGGVTVQGMLDLELDTAAPPAEEAPAEEQPVASPTPAEDTVQPQPDAAEDAVQPTPVPDVIHVDYDGPALPANATMDQYNLGLAATISPVDGAEGWWVSSPYGWREHPVDEEEKFHNGVDLAVNTGTSIKAFADGVVDYIGDSPVYGLYTQIDHGNGVTSFYAHCSELLVQQGQTVSVGDVIALSGATGNATGPHLHFELKKEGILLNPLYYIPSA